MAHQRAQDAFAALLANVRADQLGGPTPCSEWTINDLIEHVVGGNEQVGRWAASPIEPPARPDGLVAAHQAAAAVAHEIFAAPGGMSATFKLPLGEVPGQVFIGLRTTDVLTHAWDLAAATGQSTDLDPELAVERLAAARALVGPQFRGPGKPFADEKPCPRERPARRSAGGIFGPHGAVNPRIRLPRNVWITALRSRAPWSAANLA
ncbi:TIGR03086 family metal-binding protein [Mycobacterium tuberculosis]|uniref:TIGR03086 family metal-binding protein n=1 Tax=Mycobacterium tuberculosis TaxID=1773 RepID=UPI002029DEA1|nr:TIGR03086 family metal-binding protein [Mycobacterium tuberculosis]